MKNIQKMNDNLQLSAEYVIILSVNFFLCRNFPAERISMKKITIITGHYGSGKTNLAVNLAVQASREGKAVAVVDLDIVNPYFRTADFRELFA